jgi:aryl sulfotransferase
VTRTIWLASYPKSGNTWFRIMVANLSAKDGKPVDINDRPYSGPRASAREPFDELLLIDSDLLTHDEIDCLRPRVYEELARNRDGEEDVLEASPRVSFSLVHDAYQLTPKGEPLLAGRRGADGAILIVRDPRDVAPSLANYMRVNIDRAIAILNDKQAEAHVKAGRLSKMFRQRYRGWSGHAQSWLEQTDVPVHLVRYEDMKADTVGTFARALEFAGEPATNEDIRRAVAFADFAELQRQEREKGFCENPVRPGGLFFRSGEAGAWRDELSAEQVTRIEAAHAPMMRRLGYGPAGAVPLARAASDPGHDSHGGQVEYESNELASTPVP